MAYAKNIKKNTFGIGIFFLLIIAASTCNSNIVLAEGTIGTGGADPVVEGCGGDGDVLKKNNSNGVVYSTGGQATTFNCCNLYHEQCTRWIKVTKSQFAEAYAQARTNPARYGSYNDADAQQCINGKSQYVIMAGLINDYKTSWTHNYYDLVLYNNRSTNAKGSRNGYSFDWANEQFRNFWNEPSDYKDPTGNTYSWSDLLDTLEFQKGLGGDKNVAFFCGANLCETIGSCEGGTTPQPPDPIVDTSVCGRHVPSSGYPGTIYSGRTSTYSSITSNVFPGENTTIWAKPGDTVYWNHCYYPGAQPVLKSSGSHSEPKPTYNPGDDQPTAYEHVDNTIGEQDTFVASSNNFTISTANSGYLNATPRITLTNSSFSPTIATGSSVSFSHTRGNSDWTGADSNTMKILPQGVNSTITQSIRTQTGTNSVSGHSTWSWSWTYTYMCHGCCTRIDHYDEYECGTEEKPKTCRTPVYEDYDCYKTGHGTGTGNHYNSGDNKWYSVSSSTSSGGTSAQVNIPYNYTNYGDVQFGSSTIYAGEQFSTSEAVASVGTIYNETTKGTYATKTPQVTAKLYIFYAPNNRGGGGVQVSSSNHGDCNYYSSVGYSGCVVAKTEYSTLNNDYNVYGSSNDTFFKNQTYNVYDLPAGYQFCIGISLWPAQSANGGKDMSSSGNGMTYYSTPTCQDIFKKSSFQVWGGSLITNGKLNVPVSVKNNLMNYYGYSLNGSDASIYGSWVEYAIVAGGSGSVAGLSSGASGAYTTNSNGTLTANPGGTRDSKSDNYCKRTPLSLANTSCRSNTPSAGVGVSTAILRSVKENILTTDEAVTYRASGTNANLASDYNLSKDGQTRRTYFAKNATVNIRSSSALPATTTHVIYVENGTVNINSDLKYVDTKYTSINQVPQYIIYAKNINIACSVKVVNAWLLADGGKIDTCYDGGSSYDSSARSVQLRVNGPVVANNVKMGRTYGTAYGKYTEEAGEIFNYTPMTYMWSETGATNTPTLYNTYTKEISPRY